MSDLRENEDDLDRAFAALRQRQTSDGPSLDLVDQTIKRLTQSSDPNQAQRRYYGEFKMKSVRLIAGALATAAVVLVAFLIQSSGSGNVFADVQAALANVKSAQYAEKRVNRPPPNYEPQPGEVSTTPADMVQADGSEMTRTFILGRYKSRTEHIDSSGNPRWVYIIDTSKGEQASLDVAAKRFTSLRKQVIIHEDGSTEEYDITSPNLEVDFYRRISELPSDEMTELPEQEIDGRSVHGFKLTETLEHGIWERIYWVDPATNLPVQVEIDFQSTREGLGSARWVQSDFVFGAELDASLFSTAPPEGYEVEGDPESEKIFGLSLE